MFLYTLHTGTRTTSFNLRLNLNVTKLLLNIHHVQFGLGAKLNNNPPTSKFNIHSQKNVGTIFTFGSVPMSLFIFKKKKNKTSVAISQTTEDPPPRPPPLVF